MNQYLRDKLIAFIATIIIDRIDCKIECSFKGIVVLNVVCLKFWELDNYNYKYLILFVIGIGIFYTIFNCYTIYSLIF